MSHKKIGPDQFSRFDVYWIQTDRQTDRQAKFIYRLKKSQNIKYLQNPKILNIDKIPKYYHDGA